jgi:alkylation response protein AidB-like acyl-CoA dehydrogenase
VELNPGDMDFEPSERERRFREELRSWLGANLPAEWRTEHPKEPWDDARRQLARRWQARLAEARYVAMDWPVAWGGREATLGERVILQTELIRARAPRLIGHVGLDLVGPALIARGTDSQRKRHLEPIRSAAELWCQGFSEPGAGSDLAGLRTRADLAGDHWIVNGQKVWTSVAEVADWCFLLARSDPAASKHAGISALLVDMRSPGVTVRPLRQITGETEFNEVFFEDVRVPRENVVGRPGEGWTIAMGILAHERGPMWTFLFHGIIAEDLARLIDLARRRGHDRDPRLRQRLAAASIDVEVMRLLGCRSLTSAARGEAIGPRTSLEKLFGSELSQRVSSLAADILGSHLLLDAEDPRVVGDGRWARRYVGARADTIMGGTSEIQRGVIARQLLGLPRS